MSDHFDQPIPAKHLATDRFGKTALHTAQEISATLAEVGEDDGPVVLRTDGPHRSLAELESLIDNALAEEDQQ